MFNLAERYKQNRFQRYAQQLLTRKLRLAEVPDSLRRDPDYARGVYITAFRADRTL